MAKVNGTSKKRKQLADHKNEQGPSKKQLIQPDDDDDEENIPSTFPENENNDDSILPPDGSADVVLKCLRNHLILATIFKQLSYQDLCLNCALVNSTWNQAANEILQRIKILQIRFKCESYYDWSRREITRSSIFLREIEYKDVKECQEVPFSVVGLAILREKLSSVDKKEVWVELDYECRPPPIITDSLAMVCPLMTRLTIDDQNRWPEIPTYLPLEASMLHYLHLKRMPTRPSTDNSLPLPLDTLGHLTTISFKNCDLRDEKTLQRIFEVAHNVASIFNFPLKNIAALKENSEAQSKVKTMNVSSDNIKPENLNLLLSFASSLRLEKLFMSLTKVCRSSQSTRREMELWPNLPSAGFSVPAIPALIALILSKDVENLYVFSTPNNSYMANATANFPNSNSLVIDLGEKDSLIGLLSCLSDKIIEDGHNFRSIRHLKICEHIGKQWTRKIVQIVAATFPKIKTFDVGPDKKWMEVFLPSIWEHWSDTLEELSLNIELKGGRYLKFPFLDEAITGIPEKECKALRNSGVKQKVKDIKVLSGISDMKVLKKFSIILDGYDLNWGSKVIISDFAAHYGFQLLPGLEVNIRIPYDSHYKDVLTKLIHPIVPHVNFDSDYVKP